jgi:hypothetical protein
MAAVQETLNDAHSKEGRTARSGVLRLSVGIWLVALSSLMFEITVTRIFSVTLL